MTALFAVILMVPQAEAKAAFDRGVAAQQSGRLAEAESALLEAARLAPAQLAIWGNLGAVRSQRGDYPGALAAYRRALELSPEASGIRWNMAVAYFKQSDFPGSIAELDHHLKNQPGDAKAIELRALSLYQTGRYGDAAAQFHMLVDREGETLAYLYGLGQSLLRLGDRERGEKVIERLFALFPDAAEMRLLSAQNLMSENRYEEALAELARAGSAPGMDLWRGIALEGLSRTEEALEAYHAEIRGSGDLLAFYAAGILEQRNGRSEKALALLSRALPLDSARYNVSYYLGRAFLNLGKYDRAVSFLKTSLTRNAGGGERYLLLQAYRKMGKTVEASSEATAIRRMKARRVREDRPFRP